MKFNLCIAALISFFITSCKIKNSQGQSPASDSAVLVHSDTVHSDGTFPIGDALKKHLKNSVLVAMLDCPIDELSSDGNNGLLKKQDCLDSLDHSRDKSVINIDSIVSPVFLPNVLVDNQIFEKRSFVEATAEGDSSMLEKELSTPHDLIRSGDEWIFRTSGWLSQSDANKVVTQVKLLTGFSAVARHDAKGGVVMAACLNFADSLRITKIGSLNRIPLKFARIKYLRNDAVDLKVDGAAGENE